MNAWGRLRKSVKSEGEYGIQQGMGANGKGVEKEQDG